MSIRILISLCLLFLFCAVGRAESAQDLQQKIKTCPLEATCSKGNETSAICRLDEAAGCIRKYESKCHMDIAACNEGKLADYSDYSDVYCTMETYICEETPTFERWTLFFGHLKD